MKKDELELSLASLKQIREYHVSALVARLGESEDHPGDVLSLLSDVQGSIAALEAEIASLA